MSIKSNISGSYTAVFYDKRRRRRKTFTTHKLAEMFLSKKRLEKENDFVFGRTNKLGVEQLFKDYLSEVKKSAESVERDKHILRRWKEFLSYFNIKSVSQINKGLIADYEKRRKEDGVCQRTVNIDLRFLDAAINHALKFDRIAFNPIAKYPYKPDNKPFGRYLTAQEIELLLVNSGSHFDAIYTLLATGMRTSELCNLEGKDVKDGIIHIRPKKIKGVLWSPKWGRERFITINDYVKDSYINSVLDKQGLIFPEYHQSRDLLYKTLKRIIMKSGIEKPQEVCTHTLRHTHISHMVANNVNLRLIMSNVGINDFKTLLRYTQAVPVSNNGLPWQYHTKERNTFVASSLLPQNTPITQDIQNTNVT